MLKRKSKRLLGVVARKKIGSPAVYFLTNLMFTCNLKNPSNKKAHIIWFTQIISLHKEQEKDDILHCKFLSYLKFKKGSKDSALARASHSSVPSFLCSCTLGNSSSPFLLWLLCLSWPPHQPLCGLQYFNNFVPTILVSALHLPFRALLDIYTSS